MDSSASSSSIPSYRIHGGAKTGSDGSSPSTSSWDDRPPSRFDNDDTVDTTNSTITMTGTLLPAFSLCLKSMLSVTVLLYILNQKHLLPLPLSRVVSKTLFWPTLPLTFLKRIRGRGSWSTKIDNTVIMGGAPFGFAGLPEKLYQKYDIRGAINLCEEYKGPIKQYQNLGITQLYLPTPDHFEPSLQDIETAVKFIKKFQEQGSGRVYVHCRAGHGRSAAIVLAWLLSKDPNADARELNEELCKLRNVRKTLWKQVNLRRFQAKIQRSFSDFVSESDEEDVELLEL